MKNESKHTPGPWTDKDCKVYAVKPPLASFGPKRREVGIADCAVWRSIQVRDITVDEAAANARLIAAAPELLAELKSIAEEMENAPMLTDVQEARLEGIQRLIDKAEGR